MHRTPVASVGVLWSQRNTDFFGRDAAGDAVDAPYTGFMHALVRARIPYRPVHADDLDRQATRLQLLILPNIGTLSDSRLRSGVTTPRGSLLVAGGQPAIALTGGTATFEIASILDHEVVVLE